jgi:hypothetical protein
MQQTLVLRLADSDPKVAVSTEYNGVDSGGKAVKMGAAGMETPLTVSEMVPKGNTAQHTVDTAGVGEI